MSTKKGDDVATPLARMHLQSPMVLRQKLVRYLPVIRPIMNEHKLLKISEANESRTRHNLGLTLPSSGHTPHFKNRLYQSARSQCILLYQITLLEQNRRPITGK